jgi:arylformamidase
MLSRIEQRRFLDYDQSALDKQYDQRAWAPNALEVIKGYAFDSDAVRSRLGEPQPFAYGETDVEVLDVFRTTRPKAPIHVFIHGGAWRLLTSRESAFLAETFVHAGAHFVALNFALLPSVSLTEMAMQVRKAIAWIYRNAGRFDGDHNHIYVSGHSSGGHLAAVTLTTDWSDLFGLPNSIIQGGMCVSGIFDLEPVRLSSRNDYVKVDMATQNQLSPIRHIELINCPIVIAHGQYESDEFRRQAREFYSALERAHHPVKLIEGPGLNHFEVINTLSKPHQLLGKIALEQMKLGQH